MAPGPSNQNTATAWGRRKFGQPGILEGNLFFCKFNSFQKVVMTCHLPSGDRQSVSTLIYRYSCPRLRQPLLLGTLHSSISSGLSNPSRNSRSTKQFWTENCLGTKPVDFDNWWLTSCFWSEEFNPFMSAQVRPNILFQMVFLYFFDSFKSFRIPDVIADTCSSQVRTWKAVAAQGSDLLTKTEGILLLSYSNRFLGTSSNAMIHSGLFWFVTINHNPW